MPQLSILSLQFRHSPQYTKQEPEFLEFQSYPYSHAMQWTLKSVIVLSHHYTIHGRLWLCFTLSTSTLNPLETSLFSIYVSETQIPGKHHLGNEECAQLYHSNMDSFRKLNYWVEAFNMSLKNNLFQFCPVCVATYQCTERVTEMEQLFKLIFINTCHMRRKFSSSCIISVSLSKF